MLSTLSSCFCFPLKWWHPTLTTYLLVSHETLIKAGSYHLFMQNTLTLWLLTTGQLQGRTAAKISPEEWSLQAVESHSLQCWVFSISCSHTLHCPRAFTAPHPYGFNRSCDIASSSVCKTSCFSTSTLFYCVFFCSPNFEMLIMHTIWQCTLILSLTPSFFVSSRSFPLDSRFPTVNRECIVPGQILSVLGVDCFVCGNHHDGWRSPRCLQCVQADVSTHSPSFCFYSPANINSVWFGVLLLLFFPFQSRRVTANVASFSFVDETIPWLQG